MSTSETPPPPVTPVAPITEDRTVAILAYITIIGFIIAIVMHGSKKTPLGSFHLRQVLGLVVTGLALWLPGVIISMIPVVNLMMILVWPVIAISMFVLWLLGLIAAASGQRKPVPVLGDKYQQWFASAFN